VAIEQTVRIEGLAELERAFREAGKGLASDLHEVLKTSAAPVQHDAEILSLTGIRKMGSAGSREIGIPWARMRVGLSRHTAYVAPASRGKLARQGRHGLFDLLMGRALEPALAQNRRRIEQEFEDAVADMCRAWSRV
jgi:hypothetical protein